MTTTTMMTAEEELLDATAKSILRDLLQDDEDAAAIAEQEPRNLQISHQNSFADKDADDSVGLQGGQLYSPPTQSPTSTPTPAPTLSPTSRPTLGGREHILRGLMWYDRNANGVRDSNVKVENMGGDVEFSHAVGGVSVQVIECDRDTGREYIPPEGEELDSYAAATTIGFDVNYKPRVVPQTGENGKFNIWLNGINRYYYVQVTAPSGFLFTSGVCNDDEEGWECDYSTVVDAPDGSGSRQLELMKGLEPIAPIEEASLGIKTGRSTSCVFVDHRGVVQAPINFGVMRLGDTQEVAANVALMLDFDEDSASTGRHRSLQEMLQNARVLSEEEEEGGIVTTRYLLGDTDKQAIGLVTAEVLASTLDSRLAIHGVELDSVNPKEVILSNSRPSDQAASEATNQLAVAMEIRGHYSPPPDLDFDYIVQDSINRDTATIRRGLREYNSNCRAQTSKVNGGYSQSDFAAVVSNSGALRPGRGGGRPVKPQDLSALNNVYSTACSSGSLVPDYFETSLKEIEARRVSEVKFDGRSEIVYVAEESRGLESWAMGPVAGIAGLIVLLMGAFVFRRALGPRRVDKYSDGRKTKEVDGEEMRRFGEAGGDMDDGSVDSAFYSDSDEDIEETEKERKMRRKRKEKEDEQNTGKSKTSKKGKSASKYNKDRSNEDKRAKKLAVSVGSDDTESLGKSSNSLDKSGKSSSFSEELEGKEGRTEKKQRSSYREKESRKKSSSRRRDSEASERSDRKSTTSKRGRNRKSGGDNARIV